MNHSYERQWKEALAGATVLPTEEVWQQVAARLDRERGLHGWVTLLLVAATISVVFALPLTVGEATFNAQPQLQQQLTADNQQDPVFQAEEPQAASAASAWPATQVTTRPDDAAETFGAYSIPTLPVQRYSVNNMQIATQPQVVQPYIAPWYVAAGKEKIRKSQLLFNLGGGSNGGKGNFSVNDQLTDAGLVEGEMLVTNSGIDLREEKPGSTFYIGAGWELPLGKKWSLQAGLGYLSRQSKGISNIIVEDGDLQLPVTTYDRIPEEAVYLTETYDYRVTNSYLVMPVVFKYPFVDRKVKFRGGVGLSADILLSHAATTREPGRYNYVPADFGYRPVALSGLLNLDVSYAVAENYAMAFETGWRQNLTNMMGYGELYPSSFTLGLLFYYRL